MCKVLCLFWIITFFAVVGVTVDRSQGKQGENDKSQQDESYFKVCEGQLHQLLLLCLGKSIEVYCLLGVERNCFQ